MTWPLGRCAGFYAAIAQTGIKTYNNNKKQTKICRDFIIDKLLRFIIEYATELSILLVQKQIEFI